MKTSLVGLLDIAALLLTMFNVDGSLKQLTTVNVEHCLRLLMTVDEVLHLTVTTLGANYANVRPVLLHAE